MANVTQTLRSLPVEVRLHRLEALVEASETLNRATDLDDILRKILELVSAKLDCERATTFLFDERASKLHARLMSGTDQVEIILERGIGIAGYVAETGESVLINDVQSDSRFDKATDLQTGFSTRTMLYVPLRTPENRLMGSLQAINARGGEFTSADLAYLESFAALAAVGVEREQLSREAVRAQLMSTELQLARQIQQRLLPPAGRVNLPTPFSAWGVSQPCYDVGGDAYDAVMLASGECAFWVADVSGKGVGAALLMTTLQTELRTKVVVETDLARLASKLNRKVTEAAPHGTYATLFVGLLSATAGRLRYVNAGHQLPVWVNRHVSESRNFSAGGLPVGLLPDASYEEGECAFVAGERLAVFSDGVTDAENNSGESFDEGGVERSVGRINARDVGDIGTSFMKELDRFRIGAPAKDDTTLLIVGVG